MQKKCKDCGETRDSSEFPSRNDSRDGYSAYCKICSSDREKRRYRERKDEHILTVLSWQFDNFEKVREYKRRYKQKEKQKRHENNPRKIAESNEQGNQ